LLKAAERAKLTGPLHCVIFQNITRSWSKNGGGAFFFEKRFPPFFEQVSAREKNLPSTAIGA